MVGGQGLWRGVAMAGQRAIATWYGSSTLTRYSSRKGTPCLNISSGGSSLQGMGGGNSPQSWHQPLLLPRSRVSRMNLVAQSGERIQPTLGSASTSQKRHLVTVRRSPKRRYATGVVWPHPVGAEPLASKGVMRFVHPSGAADP